jgi:hypothetical protein
VRDHAWVEHPQPIRHLVPTQAAVAEELRLRGVRARGA